MTKSLKISTDLRLPLDWITLATVIYGARGSGKTSLGRVFAEEATKARQRFCAIDLKGDWWGLKSSADGKQDGIPVVVFGGDHQDVPLEHGAGKFVGETVAKLEQSCILDLEYFSKGKQVRFLADFFLSLYDANREPLLLLLDEAQRYAPQSRMPDPDSAKCLGAVEDLVKLGRKHGIGPVLFTQRGSGLNKEVSELCDLLVAFRTPGPLDQDRVKDWLDANTTKAQRDQVMGQLSGLATGTAVFASGHPDLKLFGVHPVRWPETFDSSATPKVGQRRLEPKKLAKPDIEDLRVKMATAIERAKADDPQTLRARIATLETELVKLRKHPLTTAPVKPLVVPAFDEGEFGLLFERVCTEADAVCARAAEAKATIGRVLVDSRRSLREAVKASGKPRPIAPVPAPAVSPATRRAAAPAGGGPGVAMPSAQRKILQAVVQSGGVATKRKVALVAGYSIGGGGFNNALGALRASEWIIGFDPIEVTEAGQVAVGGVPVLPSGAALLDHWKNQCGKAEALILQALADAGGSLAKAALAAATGYAVDGGGFNNALGRLRTLEIISGGGELVLGEEFLS
jgi:hypothetical protein